MSSIKKRIISAVIGILLLFLIVSKAGSYLNISILLLSLLGMREPYNAFKNIEMGPIKSIGYLAASKIKRWAKIKDFGKIMPGHGGVLDRFDSIIFTAPLAYYYLKYFSI